MSTAEEALLADAAFIDTAEAALDLDWSKPRIEATRYGTQSIIEAPATERFWSLWRECKRCCKEAGFHVRKISGQWLVSFTSDAERPADPPAGVTMPSASADLARDDRSGADLAGSERSAGIVVPVPDGRTLLAYQIEDVRRIVAMKSVLLASEPGVGKTVIVAGIANAINARSILIVAPAKLLTNWQDELASWLVEAEPALIVSSAVADQIASGRPIVVSYETATQPGVLQRLAATPWDLICFDEAHAFGNNASLRTQSLIGNNQLDAPIRIMATGTPFKNRPIELWPMLRWLDPERWADRHAYGMRYCNARFINGEWDYSRSSNMPELNRILRDGLMIRRTKAEVLPDLPSKDHRLVVIPPNGEQSELIRREHAMRAVESIDPDRIADAMAQADIGSDENLAAIRSELALTKASAIIRHVEGIARQGEKVVLFCHHRALVDVLSERWGQHAVRIVGGQTAKQSAAAVTAFQTDPTVLIAVCSTRAAGAGLTLTASCRVVFGEADWSPGTMSQAEDRVHRIGQRRPVIVEHLCEPACNFDPCRG